MKSGKGLCRHARYLDRLKNQIIKRIKHQRVTLRGFDDVPDGGANQVIVGKTG